MMYENLDNKSKIERLDNNAFILYIILKRFGFLGMRDAYGVDLGTIIEQKKKRKTKNSELFPIK